MISTKWILAGLAVSLLSGILFNQLIIGVIFGSLTTLVTDTYTAGRKRVIGEKR
jgi:hypothetical protein